MGKAIFRFYEELNTYLPPHRRKRDFEVQFEGRQDLRELIEVLGVPCDLVDLILANGKSVDFSHVPGEGERISVYPVFESLNIAEVTRLPSRPLRAIKFVVDADLRGLAEYLMKAGYDVRCDAFISKDEMAAISREEKRIILTTDPRFLERQEMPRVIFLPSDAPEIQVKRILEQLDLYPRIP